VSIAQLAEICIVICRGWGSNPKYPIYSPYALLYAGAGVQTPNTPFIHFEKDEF